MVGRQVVVGREGVGLRGVICEVEGEGRSIGPGESHG